MGTRCSNVGKKMTVETGIRPYQFRCFFCNCVMLRCHRIAYGHHGPKSEKALGAAFYPVKWCLETISLMIEVPRLFQWFGARKGVAVVKLITWCGDANGSNLLDPDTGEGHK